MERFNLSLTAYLAEINEGLIPSGSTVRNYLYVPSGQSETHLIYKTTGGTKYNLLKNITTINVADITLTGNTLNIDYSDGSTSGITLSTINTFVTGGTYSAPTLTLGLSDGSSINVNNVRTDPAGTNSQVQINSSGSFGAVNNFTIISGVLKVPTGITTNYITLGSTSVTTNGTIRYNGSNFQGRKPSGWVNLDSTATDTFVTGGTLSGTNLILSLNSGGSTSAIDLSVLTSGVGTGTQNYLAKWDSTTGLTNSLIQDNGTIITVDNVSTQFSISDTTATLISGDFVIGAASGSTTITGLTGLILNNSLSGDVTITNSSSSGFTGLISDGYNDTYVRLAAGDDSISYINLYGGTGNTSVMNFINDLTKTIGGSFTDTISGTKESTASVQTINATSGVTLSGYSQSLIIGESGTTISGQIINVGKRIEHLIGGATFYSGGGDDEGAFTGDYSIYIGEEAISGFTTSTTFPVNVGLGYGVFRGSTNLDFMVAIGGGAARDVTRNETPPIGPASASGVLIGANAGRDISSFNASVGVGSHVTNRIDTIFRSTVIGNHSFEQPTKTGVELYKVTSVGSYLGHDSAVNDAIYSHIVAMGHETLLNSSGATDSILIGDYIGINERVDDSIFIGNYRTSGSSYVELTGVTSNVISVGHNLIPIQENTINFPTAYNMGVGTLEPTQKLHVDGNIRVTGHIYDSANSTGSTNYVLTTTSSGITWASQAGSTDTFVTGGTISSGTLELDLNTGGNVNISGFRDDAIYVTGGTANNTTLTLRRANAANIGIDISAAGAPSFSIININQGTVFGSETNSTVFTAQLTQDTIEFVDSDQIGIEGLYNDVTDFGIRPYIKNASIIPSLLNATGTAATDKNVVLGGTGAFRYEHSSVVHGTVTVSTNTTSVNVQNKSVVILDSGGSGSTYTISGFSGGVVGQVIYMIKENPNDVVNLKHNDGVTSQAMLLPSNGDGSLDAISYKSVFFYFNGTHWFGLGF